MARPALSISVAHQFDDALEFGDVERQTFARGGRENQSVDRAGGVVPDQPAQRRLVQPRRRGTA